MLSKAQIGRCGELLVQFNLLIHGIESSALTTDTGIDLVAFSTGSHKAVTIQVKTNLTAKPSGGTGPLHLDWWTEELSPVDFFAFVDLETRRIWFIEAAIMPSVAQQNSGGRFHFFMSVDPATAPRRDGKRIFDHEFTEYLFEHRVSPIFMQLNTAQQGAAANP